MTNIREEEPRIEEVINITVEIAIRIILTMAISTTREREEL